jgi:hypothetical protein
LPKARSCRGELRDSAGKERANGNHGFHLWRE